MAHLMGSNRAFAPQKYNADYDLSATQSADTLAFVSLLEEKLLPVLVRLRGCCREGRLTKEGVFPGAVPVGSGVFPAASRAREHCQQHWVQPHHGQAVYCSPPQIHTFWVDAKNYVEHTRKWYAETIPFPLNFFLPNAMHKRHLERLQLMWGDDYMEDEERLEKEVKDGVWAHWVLSSVQEIPVKPESKLGLASLLLLP